MDAVIFDLDGVLLDSEQLWNEAKREVVDDCGGTWSDAAPKDMMGMSAPEWTAYLRDELGVDRDLDAINRAVVDAMRALYRDELPLLPGAQEAVKALGARFPLGLASSSNREIIDLVVDEAGFAFDAIVSSEEVDRGKPAPDVYLRAAEMLGVDAGACVAVEDSSNGLRSADAAGMAVIAVPNPHYPPDEDALALAAVTVETVGEVDAALVEGVPEAARRKRRTGGRNRRP